MEKSNILGFWYTTVCKSSDYFWTPAIIQTDLYLIIACWSDISESFVRSLTHQGWEVKKSHRPKVLINCLSKVACQMIWEINRNGWSQLFSSKNKSVVSTYCSQMNKHSLKLNSLPDDLIDTSMIYRCHFKQSSLQFPNLAYSSEIPIVFSFSF